MLQKLWEQKIRCYAAVAAAGTALMIHIGEIFCSMMREDPGTCTLRPPCAKSYCKEAFSHWCCLTSTLYSAHTKAAHLCCMCFGKGNKKMSKVQFCRLRSTARWHCLSPSALVARILSQPFFTMFFSTKDLSHHH